MILRLEYDGTKPWTNSAEDGRPIYSLSVFQVLGPDREELTLHIGARNDSVAPNAWKIAEPFNVGCPPGEYVCRMPEANETQEELQSMGPWFIPVDGIEGHTGIGIHGGGSCKGWPGSQNALQGWCPTENCFRTQNEWLRELVALLQQAQSPIRFTVKQE